MLLREEKKSTGRDSFAYSVATGKAEAWSKIGDAKQAAIFQEQAVQLAPDARQPWLNLAEIIESQRAARPMPSDAKSARAAQPRLQDPESVSRSG